MSLNAREQQALHAIEDEFARYDPKLTSMLAAFTRLNSDEEMPVREKVRRSWREAFHLAHFRQRGLRRDGVLPRARRLCRRLGWQGVIVLLLLTAALGTFAAGLAVGRSGSGTRAAGSRPCSVQVRLPGCPPVAASAGVRGRSKRALTSPGPS